MSDEICTDIQISKLITNSREPIIVETKTTTTTTTVTKRICIANDANVDLTDIQSLLETKENLQTKAIPPNADDISKNVSTSKKDKRASIDRSSSRKSREGSFLSSTKIDSLTESNDIKDFVCENETLKQKSLSPNLSKNKSDKYFEAKNKNFEKKTTAKKNSKYMEATKDKCSVRSKTDKNRSNINKDNKYIDSLINEYMTLEKNPKRKPSKKREKVEKKEEKKEKKEEEKKEENEEKKKTKKKTECAPPVELKDLSAIFEQSTEFESPFRPRPKSLSPIQFDGICNDDYDIGPVENQPEFPNEDDELHMTGVLKVENSTNKRKMSDKDKVSDTETSKKSRHISKKQPSDHKLKNASSTKHTEPSKQSANKRSNESHSPIKIYSPSTRGKLRTGTDNRLVLTKKMIEKKLQKHPSSSEKILQRLGNSKEMMVDANSRLIYYPNKIDENEVANDIDFLSVLQKRRNPLLVKEICTNDE